MGHGRVSRRRNVPKCRMERGVSVQLRHVFPERSTPGTTARRMLHRDAVFYGRACRASFDNYAGLFSISHSRPVFDRLMERRIRKYRVEQRAGFIHRASRLCDRKPRAPRVRKSAAVSLGTLQPDKAMAAVAARRGALVA